MNATEKSVLEAIAVHGAIVSVVDESPTESISMQLDLVHRDGGITRLLSCACCDGIGVDD